MCRCILSIALLACVIGGHPAITAAQPTRAAPCVVRAEMKGIINSGSADYLRAAVTETEQRGCTALLVVLDTPGGELEATRSMVQTLLEAPVPVVVYVAPGGARAGSAGVFVTMAAHVAAMAPGATIGAAHPVVGLGADPEEAGGEELARKIVNDTAAMARAIAQRRDRNVEWAEAAVRESISATAAEAQAANVIDRVAPSEQRLLAELDGTSVQTTAGTVSLATAGAEVHSVDMTLRQRVWSFVGNPNVVYFLLIIGIIGLLVEMYSPGLIIPGVIGAFALLLAAIGLNILPVNLGALVLIALAVVLFVAEVYVASYGLLGLAGLGALILGASLLIDRSAEDFFADATVGLSWGAVLPLALVVASATAGLAWRAARLRRLAATTGKEEMLGKVGEVLAGITGAPGEVRLEGERWRAVADEPIPAGTRVRVLDMDGLTLRVAPAETPPERARST